MLNWIMPRISLRRRCALRWVSNLLVAAAFGALVIFCVYRTAFVGTYRQVESGRLYRSRQPKWLQYSALFHGRGIRRVINLRSPDEDLDAFRLEKSICRREGVEFINMPMTAQGPTKSQAERFLQLVDTSPGAVLVHCEHGRNRTGMMSAIYRIARQGVSVEQAFREELLAYNIRRVRTNRKAIIRMLEQFVPVALQPGNHLEAARP